MNELRTLHKFTQIRFRCYKQHGRTIDLVTVANSTGEAVVEYFSGQTDKEPSSCGSFARVKGDNSRLAKQCTRWGTNKTTGQHYAGLWSGTRSGEEVMYDHALYVAREAHWTIGRSGGRWECDDFVNVNYTVSENDFWRVYVR